MIGVNLRDKVVTGSDSRAALARGKGGSDTARAIMTTDPFPERMRRHGADWPWTFTGRRTAMAARYDRADDGDDAGFLTTDALVPSALLQRALKESARDTFNAITVDGDGSTNDSLYAYGVRRQRRDDR